MIKCLAKAQFDLPPVMLRDTYLGLAHGLSFLLEHFPTGLDK